MANISYKLLVIDIDGTLLGESGVISTEDREALTRAGRSGIRVSLSTGRAARACLKTIEELSLNGEHIFFDGALVTNPENNRELYVKPIGKDILEQIIDYTHRQGMDIDLYSATSFFVERENWSTEIRRRFFGLEPTITGFSQLWQKERVIKGTLVVASAGEKARAEEFRNHFQGSLSFSWTKTPAYPEVDFINVTAPDVSKGQALEALVAHMGISLDEVIAIGDGANDISVLSRAGLAVAMGNANDEVKAAAHHVTLDVDSSGVAAAVERFIL